MVVPAIDVLGGKVVRLRNGVESTATVYSDDPAEVVSSYAELGAKIIHVVDLDLAIHNDPKNAKVVEGLCATKTKIQIAGGIRSEASATRLTRLGASRVVIGSLAFRDPALAKSILVSLGPERVVLALDYDKSGFVKTDGWQKKQEESALDAVKRNYATGYEQFLLTSISKDGTLEGPDLEMLHQVRRVLNEVEHSGEDEQRRPARIIASGGITAKEDLLELEQSKVDEAIVGRAFYEGRLDPSETIRAYGK